MAKSRDSMRRKTKTESSSDAAAEPAAKPDVAGLEKREQPAEPEAALKTALSAALPPLEELKLGEPPAPPPRKPKINGYEKDREHDYVQLRVSGKTEIGLCEIEGIRYPYQEDAIRVSTQDVAALPSMKDSDINNALDKTMRDLQEKYGQVDSIGTTCCSTTAWVDPATNQLTAWTANLGDSGGILVILDKDGNLKKAEQLNTLHDPDTASELERLKNFHFQGQTVAEFIHEEKSKGKAARLPLGLKLSRGFGDTDADVSGFSHDPEIVKKQVKLDEGDQAFVIVHCDGLTETALSTAEKVGNKVSEMVKQNRNISPDIIAEGLVNAAFNGGKYRINPKDRMWDYDGSTDNISAGVFRVGATPTSVTVLDGHGGSYQGNNPEHKGKSAAQLATTIGDDFYKVLQRNVKNVNPLLEHVQAWEAAGITPPPERAFVVNGRNQGPEPSIDLMKQLAKDARELWQIYADKYEDMSVLQNKLQEYFQKRGQEIDAILGGKDAQSYSHGQKLDAYNSYLFAVKSYVMTELMPADSGMDKIKIFSDLIDKYRIPSSTPPMTPIIQNDIPDVSKQDVTQAKDAMQLLELVNLLKSMRDDYKTLGRTTHIKAFDTLITDLEKIKGANPTRKLENAVAKIQAAFDGRRTNQSSVFHLSSGSDPLKFINDINADPKGHEFPRLLALALELASRENSRLRAPTVGAAGVLSSKVHIGGNAIYNKYVPLLLSVADKQKFSALQQQLKDSGMTEAQMYRLYAGIDKLTAKLAKKIWPVLKNELNLSDKLIEKLSNPANVNAVTKEVIDHFKRAAVINNQLSTVGIGGKQIPENKIKAQCDSIEKQLRNIAQQMQAINENAQKPASIEAKRPKMS